MLDDPAMDARADYDYTGGDVAHPDLVTDLEAELSGEIRFDTYSRQLYATDASAYEVLPIGVVFPASTADVVAVIEYCAAHGIPVLPRGGGTSLAGQAVNEAVVLDFTVHMSDLLDVDPDNRLARVQAGAVLAELNAALEPHDLKFAPDPAAGDRSTIGGAIGNNSTGAHSLKYGKTDAYIEECEVVLADGTVTTFGEVSIATVRDRADCNGGREARIYDAIRRIIDDEADTIRDAYPQLKRNVSGYNLDELVREAREANGDDDATTINLARVLAGSEGTLGIVTEATVSLEPVPETKSVALLTYRTLQDAMADVNTIVKRHDPAAVEAIDSVLLDLARDTEEFTAVAAMLPEETEAALLVEFYADSATHSREKVERLLSDRVVASDHVHAVADKPEPVRAFDALEAYSSEERSTLWKLRKSGLPILLSRTSDEKHISFIEDTAVPTERLADYIADFQVILEENDTFASFYAHAGPGCMHMRPLVNTKRSFGVEQMESIADAVTDLVVEYEGSVSGEHGDGRARTQWNRKLYGEHVWRLFRDLKSAFDPDWLLNPGQVCGDVKMTENLRMGPEYEADPGFGSDLVWDNENGMQGMIELCHGCGGCRGQQDTTGGVMCPTYRAAEEESVTTRGRANLLRQAISGDLAVFPGTEGASSSRRGEFDVEFMSEVMDLCIGCKGCARDCPSEVDMAKLKTEIEHAYHEKHGASLREKLFANIDRLNALGSTFAPISNWVIKIPGVRTMMEETIGIASERSLPTFHRETFRDWFERHEPKRIRGSSGTERRGLLFPDTYTNYNHPEAGKAAVRVLESAGVRVEIPDTVTSTGRPAHSKGFVDTARERARTNVKALAPYVREGWDVVLVEPSDAVMLQSDYLDLISGRDVERVATNTYGVLEYLDRFNLDGALDFVSPDESLIYHGHCHQKATKKDHHAVGILRRAGYEVDPIDSGCCGMAGSFGYEAEHYSMSKAIAHILFEQVEKSTGEVVTAPGASCRTQLGERDGATEPPHPIEKLADIVVE